MGFSTATNTHLIRSNLWSAQLKDILEDELMANQYVDYISDFPDGDTLNIPSIAQAETNDYVENTAIRYTAMDTGNFTFTIDQYKSSATYITEKMRQDSYYAARLEAMFVPKQARALAVALETNVLSVGPAGQTSGDNQNLINGAPHRFVANGASETLVPQDFALAKYSLLKANVPMTNLVAIVDPSVGYALETMTNLVNMSNNPRWEGIVATGITTGMRFIKNVYGFDVYTSNYLKTVTDSALNTAADVAVDFSTVNGKLNLFFSAAPTVTPFVGAWRQPPQVDYEYNKDKQRHEYVTTCRYGMKLYRPENMVRVVTKTNV